MLFRHHRLFWISLIFPGILAIGQTQPNVNAKKTQKAVSGQAYASPLKAQLPSSRPRIPFKSPIWQRLWQTTGTNRERASFIQAPVNLTVSPFLSNGPSYGAGTSLYEALPMAVGDFNGDGPQDVIAAADPPVILLGNGDGTLQAAVPIGTVAATDVVNADFNRDGKLDVAFAIGGAALVYPGNGDGTFGPGVSYSSGGTNNDSMPRILLADVNHDGVPDLVLNTDTGVSVLMGKGDGTFQTAKLSNSSSVGLMTAADFNKDGRIDLAVSDGFSTLSILLGQGNGTFLLASTYSIGFPEYTIATADFNRDGLPDVALANGQLFLGNGDGTLQPSMAFPTVSFSSAVAALDVNGDGIADLLTSGNKSNSCGTADFGEAGVALGNGDGTFQPLAIFDAGGCANPVFLATGDLNGDGAPDLLASIASLQRQFTGQNVSVLLNRRKGNFQAAKFATEGGSGGITVGDFNGDNKQDIALANGSIYLGNGDGTLQFLTTIPLQGVAVASGDFNGDGKLDLAAVVETSNEMVTALGNGDGTFQPVSVYPSTGAYPESLAIADFNNDGHPDIAIVNTCVDVNCSSPGGAVTVFLNHGDGTFGAGSNIVLSDQSFGDTPLYIVAGDFNNDGNMDLAAVGCAGQCEVEPAVVNILLGNGKGGFQTPIIFKTSGAEGAAAAVAVDLNGDGILDLVLADGATCADCGGDGAIFYGNGDGTFTAANNLINTDGGSPMAVVAADFFGVGTPTPVLANVCFEFLDCPAGSVMIDGTSDVTDIELLYLGVGDFNNDGKPDLAGALQFDAGATVLLNTGAAAAATTTTLSPAGLQSYSAFQRVSFTAEVSHTGRKVATGGVTFKDNGISIGVAPLTKNGTATFTTNQLGIGAHFIVAYYGGDSNFAASNSLGAHLTITPASTTNALISGPNPSQYGQPVEFTASITPAFGTAVTGTVTFYDGSKALGSATINRNRALFIIRSLPVGTHSISAVYGGDANYTGSMSALVSQKVQPTTSSASLNSSSDPSHRSQMVVFTATVSGQYGGFPSGSVTFKDGNTTLQTMSLSQGSAQYSTGNLRAGSHQIGVIYGGNGDFLPSSAIAVQVVE
jgi:hypothetical protein